MSAAPSAEEFHLGMARSAYVHGNIDVDEFEECVAHVIRGGVLSAQGRLPGSPTHPDLPLFGLPHC